MPRTIRFALAARAMARARKAQRLPMLPRAVTRRQAILLGAGAAALAACATGERASTGRPTAIIGGGTAGLLVAYRLMEAGRPFALYEASDRFGGRMFTRRNFTADGLFCELGGELIDTGHKEIIALAAELGVGIQRLAPEDRPDEDIYDIGGRLYRSRDFLDPQTGEGAFAPLAAKIAEYQAGLLTAAEEWTDAARALDATSLKDYLQSLRPLTQAWAVDALALAYHAQYGIPVEKQSALNLVDFIGAGTAEEFALFGESDEVFRVKGGSGAIPDALYAAIKAKGAIRTGWTLTGLRTDGAGFSLRFGAGDGEVVETAERVVLALPFTRLREVAGLDGLGLSPEKLKAIRELGYGDNAKIMTATTSRPWTEPSANGFSFSGAVYSDRGFDIVWDASRGQDGTSGVLTNFMASTPAEEGVSGRVRLLDEGLAALHPQTGAALDRARRAVMLWGRHPQTKGSYAGPLVGQYTSLVEVGAPAELGGRLHFAGEHTSASSMGYMNGAVESAERVAREVLQG